jgi:protein-S-isoprenylcysteine O-methyltransferase Ste14
MGEEKQRNSGRVKDLVEKLKKEEITAAEAQKELLKRGLGHEETWKDFVGYVVWGILCFLPAVAKFSGLAILSFFAQLPAIEFPSIVIYLSIASFIVVIPLTAFGMYFNSKKGGCRSEDHTVMFLKNGPYGIVRHPSGAAWSVFFATAPIILSRVVPFTILSIIGIVEIIAYNYYECVVEERTLNIPKWGDEYRQYMKEVPRFNFILGIWRWTKRRKQQT